MAAINPFSKLLVLKTMLVITGQAGSGKSTLARRLESIGASRLCVVHADSYRYVPGTWDRLPAAVFIDKVRAVVTATEAPIVVIETSYLDAHDVEHAQLQLVKLLKEAGAAVGVIKPFETAFAQSVALMQRSLNRASGAEAPGAAETAENVVRLLKKNEEHFGATSAALLSLPGAWMGSCDEVYAWVADVLAK